MSTLTTEPALAAEGSKTQFILRKLHSLTGIMFGLYVMLHLSVNASLIDTRQFDGKTMYQVQVDKIHSLPFLNMISIGLLIIPIAYHTFYGIYILLNGRPNVLAYGYGRNWLYYLQRLSALILMLFIAFHYLAFKGAFDSLLGPEMRFDPERATQSTLMHFQKHWWVQWIVYPVGVLSATFHTANGFWAAGVAWGLTVSKRAMRNWGIVCLLIFLALTAAGFTAITATMR